MSTTKLEQLEERLGVRFPASFRDAVTHQRKPAARSRYVLLDLDEVDTTARWGVPGDGVVVARSIAGGHVVLAPVTGNESAPRPLGEPPFLWEPADEDDEDDEDTAELVCIGDSFEDVLDPSRFEKSTVCPHCGSEVTGAPCRVCGVRRGQPVADDPDRRVAGAVVRDLVETGQLVARSPRATGRIVLAMTEVLRRLEGDATKQNDGSGADDDRRAASQIIEAWEDATDVEDFFVDADDLAEKLQAARRLTRAPP